MMIIADLLDLAVHDLHYFRTDRLDLTTLGPRPGEEGLRDSVAVVARADAQRAMSVGKRGKLGLVGTPHLGTTSTALAIRADQDRLVVIAGHHPFDIVAVEGVKVALNELFLGRHILSV